MMHPQTGPMMQQNGVPTGPMMQQSGVPTGPMMPPGGVMPQPSLSSGGLCSGMPADYIKDLHPNTFHYPLRDYLFTGGRMCPQLGDGMRAGRG